MSEKEKKEEVPVWEKDPSEFTEEDLKRGEYEFPIIPVKDWGKNKEPEVLAELPVTQEDQLYCFNKLPISKEQSEDIVREYLNSLRPEKEKS